MGYHAVAREVAENLNMPIASIDCLSYFNHTETSDEVHLEAAVEATVTRRQYQSTRI